MRVAGIANLGNLVAVIDSFACKETAKIFRSERSRKFPSDIQERAERKLRQIHRAMELAQLSLPPSNRLHALKGDLQGFWSISINGQWRIIFRWNEGRAADIQITDYH